MFCRYTAVRSLCRQAWFGRRDLYTVINRAISLIGERHSAVGGPYVGCPRCDVCCPEPRTKNEALQHSLYIICAAAQPGYNGAAFLFGSLRQTPLPALHHCCEVHQSQIPSSVRPSQTLTVCAETTGMRSAR